MAEAGQREERASRIIRDPRLLPYFLDTNQAADLCCVQPRTLGKWRAAGTLRRGDHYTRRGRGPRARVLYLRDGLLAMLEERDRAHRPAPPPIRSAVNPSLSPAIAAALQREAHGR